MHVRPLTSYFSALVMTLSMAGTASAISFGQIETFESCSPLCDWTGYEPSLDVPTTGGPAGPGDAYLQVQGSGGEDDGSVPATFNDTIWTGDWIAAGVTAVSIDLRLDGSDMDTDLNIRLVFLSGNSNRWTSTTAYDLENNAGWQSVTFDITEASLTNV